VGTVGNSAFPLGRSFQWEISLSLSPQKTYPLFLYIPHKNPSFKPINDHFIVAAIGLCSAKSANIGFSQVEQLFAPPTNPANAPREENSFYKFRKKNFLGVNNVCKNIRV